MKRYEKYIDQVSQYAQHRLLSTPSAQSWSISSRFSSARAAKRASSAASLRCHWLCCLKCRDQLLRNAGKQMKNKLKKWKTHVGAAGHFFACLGICFCTCGQNNSRPTRNNLIASLFWTSSMCSKWNSEPIKSCKASKAPNDCLRSCLSMYI